MSDARLDRDQITMALRFTDRTESGSADPVGASLRLSHDAQGRPLLDWVDTGAASNQVLRCDASAGACQPAHHALAAASDYLDTAAPAAPARLLWYRVQAVNSCTAEELGAER